MKKINCINIACPGPVINVKKEIDSGFDGTLEIIVDNVAARENVTRFLKSQGKNIDEIREENGIITVISTLGNGSEKTTTLKTTVAEEKNAHTGVTYIIGGNSIGRGDEVLGKKLLRGFINSLPDIDPIPKSLFFLNGGIEFTLKDSAVIDSLIALEKMGTEIITCGTCLEYHGKTELLGVGSIGNLYNLVQLHQAGNVVTI